MVGSGPEASKRGRVQAGPHSGAQRVGQAFGDKRSSACTPGNNWARGTTTTNASSAAKLGDTPTVRSLLTWNLHGLNGAKLLALTSKVNDIKPDVIIASETELALGDSPAIQGYSTLMPTVSSSTRVRVVMFIRKNLQAVQLSTPEDVPIVAAEIGSEAVIGLYRQFTPKGYSSTFEAEQLDSIELVIREISNKYKTMHVAGDMNLDPTRSGEVGYYKKDLLSKWTDLMSELGMILGETGPTFKSDGRFNGQFRFGTLDLIYTRCAREMEVTVHPDATSDHWPVLGVVKGLPQHKETKREIRRDRNWQKMDQRALELFFRNWDWRPLLAAKDVDSVVSLLNTATSAAVNIAVPQRVYESPNIAVRLKPDTRAAMRARNKAKQEGALHYKALRNKTLSLVRRDHVAHNISRIQKGGQEAAWKIAGELGNKEKTSALPLPKGCQSDLAAANECNRWFIQKVKNLRDNMKSKPAPKGKSPARATFSFHNIGVATARQALKKLKTKHSHGLDNVPITIYKAAFEALALPLVHLTNQIITTGVWPTQWKRALVTPVLKGGKQPGSVSSYRPVAGLCSVSKLVERILHDQMVSHLEENRLLPHAQHGFRVGRSVDTALTSLFSHIAEAQDSGLKVGLSAYDYSAAFDTVSKEVLESKLDFCHEAARKLLRNYVSDRTQMVKWNSGVSEVLTVNFGVPQGSILAPLLFIIVTGDLPQSVTSGVDPKTMTAVSLYADDTSSSAAGKTWKDTETALQTISVNLERFSSDCELHINMDKTQKLMLGHSGTASSETLNILGVTLDKSGGFSAHHSTVLSDLRRRLGVVRRLKCQISRGKLLNEIARSLVIGRLQCNAWVTRPARVVPQNGQNRSKDPAQVILNDLARLLLGVTRADHHRTEDLLDKAKVPSVNQIIVRQSALSAWKAANGGALEEVLQSYDSRTRGAVSNLKRPVAPGCIATSNMAAAWNESKSLREAKTLGEARAAARKLAESFRHA